MGGSSRRMSAHLWREATVAFGWFSWEKRWSNWAQQRSQCQMKRATAPRFGSPNAQTQGSPSPYINGEEGYGFDDA